MAKANLAVRRPRVSTPKSTKQKASHKIRRPSTNTVEAALARHWNLFCDDDPKTLMADCQVVRMLRESQHYYMLLGELEKIGVDPSSTHRVLDVFSVVFLAGWEAGLRAGIPAHAAMKNAKLLRELTAA